MRFPGFIGPSYTLRSVNVDCQRCVNLYPELDEIGSGKEKEVAALIGTPGLSLLQTVGSGPIRAVYYGSNLILYVVSGNKLYSVSSTWVATQLGTLNTSSGPVSMTDDGYNLVLVDGADGWNWNFAGASFTQITSPNFFAADQVTYQDSYFIFNRAGTGQFFLSDLPSAVATDPVSFAADIASAEGAPDDLVAIKSVHRDLWLFGKSSTEVWYDSGDNTFPFARIQGAFLEQGCAAAFSIAKITNTIFWLGQSEEGQGQVFMANGYSPQRISTHAVETAIQSYGTISDAVAYAYQENGHNFYVLNFTSANTTWVFDTTTSLWHERNFLNAGNEERHRANFHAFAYGKHVVGDYSSGKIYELSESTYSDAGAEIMRLRTSPHVTADLDRIFYSLFQLDIESGVGLDGVAQGTDPQAMLQFSDDGGHTWSSEIWAAMGKIGQTKLRAMWRRLGQSRDRVFRVKITDPVKVILIGARLDVMKGAS